MVFSTRATRNALSISLTKSSSMSSISSCFNSGASAIAAFQGLSTDSFILGIGLPRQAAARCSSREVGDAWTWLPLIISHRIGARNTVTAYEFVRDCRSRTVGRFQITTDALRGYIGAIEESYGCDIDYAQLDLGIQVLQSAPRVVRRGMVTAAVPKLKNGSPGWSRTPTPHVERHCSGRALPRILGTLVSLRHGKMGHCM